MTSKLQEQTRWRDEMAWSVQRGDVHVAIGRRFVVGNAWGLTQVIGVYVQREDAIQAMHDWETAAFASGAIPECIQAYVTTEPVRGSETFLEEYHRL